MSDVYLWGLQQAGNALDQYNQRQRDAATMATRLKAFDQANAADPSTPSPLAAALGQAPAQPDPSKPSPLAAVFGQAPAATSAPPSDPSAPGTSASSTASGTLPTYAAGAGTPLSPSPNMQRALSFYQSKGLSPVASAALVGGYGTESGQGLKTTAIAPGDGSDGSNSVGIAQWNGSRAAGLMAFAQAHGLDPSALDTQLQYSWAELNGPEQGTLARLAAAQTPQDATAAALGYERPAGWTPDNPLGATTAPRRLASTMVLSNWASRQQPQQVASAAPANPLGPAMPAMRAPQQQAAASPYGNLSGSGFPGSAPPSATAATTPTDDQGNGSPTALGYDAGTGMVNTPGQAAIRGAVDPRATVSGFPNTSYESKPSSPPPGLTSFGAPQAAGLVAPQTGGQPYGSQPLNINGQMLTRQQAEDTDGLDHTDYDAAAARAGLIRSPMAAPAFQDSPSGSQGASASPVAAPPVSPAQGASLSPQSGVQPAAVPPTFSAAAGARAAGIPKDVIRTLLADPTTSADGMKLWEQTLTGKNYGFVKADDGSYWRQDPQTGAFTQLTAPIQAPYSLSAGQSRYGSNNQLLASAPASGNDATKKVVQIGEDQFGNKKFGVFDSSTGTTMPLNPDGTTASPASSGGAASAPPAAPGSTGVMAMHGSDFLSTLDPATAGQVQAIVEGRAPYPTGMLLKTPYGQQLASYVTQTDPTFESGNAANRNKVRSDFESGGPNSVAGAITVANTAIGHLGELSDAAQQLKNTSFPLINSVGNSMSTAFGGNSVTDFNNIVGKYVEEATKFYRGTGGTESDITRDIQNLSPNMSPTQLNSAIATQAGLMQRKVDALQQRWRQGMGPLVPDFPIIQPQTAQVLATVNQRAGMQPPQQPGASPQQPQPAPSAARVQVRSAADYQALPSGTRYIDPNGKPRIKL